MKSFITYRIACTLELLVFFFIAVLALHPSHYRQDGDSDWPQFFHMPVLMLMLITLLNDGTLIAIGYDNAIPSQFPEKWNLKALFVVAAGLAVVVLGASLLLLACALDSWNPSGVFQTLGIGGLTYGQITTMVYLDVSISNFLTLFSARVSGNFFWTSRPSNALLGAAGIALCASTAIACCWPKSAPDGINTTGLARHTPKALAVGVWIYCLLWWVVQDCAKVGLYHLMIKYNITGLADQLKFIEEAKAQLTAQTGSLNTVISVHQ
jgi:H+-transporting ATPase